MSSVNLPPLPPVDGATTGRSVVAVLSEQHRELITLCDGLADRDAVSVLVATASRHLSAEEQYLYPAIRATVPDGDQIADRELAEDRELLVLLAGLESGQTSGEAVAQAVRRHVEADAGELFPLLEQMVPVEDLIRLGNRVEVAEEAAPTRPHPRTPSTPPWNKLVDPLLGVIDKARDTLSGRATYRRDLSR